MAKLIPSFDRIQIMKVKPTEGELHLLKMLDSLLSNDYEVYFNPYMNGDRPDVVVFHEKYGVLIIEVKDWDLDLYKLDTRKNWKLKYPKNEAERNSIIKSPISQVLKYKDNLYELHIEQLMELKIRDIRNFNFVSCAVYFHNGTKKQIENLLLSPYSKDEKYMRFIQWNIRFLSKDNLSNDIRGAMHDFWMDRPSKFGLFTPEIANNIRRFLQPTEHMKEDGIPFPFIKEQMDIIYSMQTPQKVKGVFGSGKTTVMAARAAHAASKGLNNILILCYNITLKNFIHDKLNKTPEHFNWGAFTINNYHEFINSQLNNMGVTIIPPEEKEIQEIIERYKLERAFIDISEARKKAISIYFETKYYGNISLFEKHCNDIIKYDAIYIDEIQDYHYNWMVILKNFFLKENGQYVLFGDVKQNIYGNETDNKDVKTNVPGRPKELKTCHRSNFKIRQLSLNFQKSFFSGIYDIDEMDSNNSSNNLIPFNYNDILEGYINYIYLPTSNKIKTLYNIIRGNIENKGKDINPNDITILGCKTSTLQNFEAYYRHKCHERTSVMFETYEIMYQMHLNYFQKNKEPKWYAELLHKMNNKSEANTRIAYLLTTYHLKMLFSNDFESDFIAVCKDINCTPHEFVDIIKRNQNDFDIFEKSVFSDNYEIIRKNKKIHFWMNTGTIKVSTIHSFKGWESEFVFLLLENNYGNSDAFDEVIYTGLTRSRRNLVVINFGNAEYDKKVRPLIGGIK